MTLIELTMSLMILGVATVAMIQLLATTARQRRMAQERRAALTELANQAERFSLLSWEEAAPGKLMSWQPSGELAAMLPAAECSVGIVEETESPRSRQIRLQVSWTDGVGLPVTPLGLTMWKFAREDRP